ncbi:hypothetical protein [Persephonella sp.]
MLVIINILLFFLAYHTEVLSENGIKEIESTIISRISTTLTGKHYKIKAFATDNMKYIFKYSKILIPSYECDEADVVIAGDLLKNKDCEKKVMIVTKYYLIRKYQNAVAAFYWYKGRPNIVFIKERLEKFGIKLPTEYEKYIDSEKNL